MKRTYWLKLMVLAKLLSEMTVLAILLFLAPALWWLGYFQGLPLVARLLLSCCAAVALLALPCYGFLTFQVTIDESGIVTRSLFKTIFVEWEKLQTLRLRSSWRWKRYVLECEGAELAFPIWLDQQKELLEVIRSRLPQGAKKSSSKQVFKQDLTGLTYQFVRVFLGCGFIVVFWLVYANVSASGKFSLGDTLLLFVVCVLVTLVVGWRCFLIALMPRYLELTDNEIVLRTCFFEQLLPWGQVLKLAPTFFLLPEGFMLKSKKGSYLISESFDDADELFEAIQAKLAQKPA